MPEVHRALLAAAGTAFLGGFAPAPAPVILDGQLPPRTEVSYRFGCASGRIDIGFAERLAAGASSDRFRTLELLDMAVSGRAIPPRAFAEVAELVRSYERIESVSAECGPSDTASLHVRGLRKAQLQAHIAALEAHQSAPAGTTRPERPDGVTTTITVAPSGEVAIRS